MERYVSLNFYTTQVKYCLSVKIMAYHNGLNSLESGEITKLLVMGF